LDSTKLALYKDSISPRQAVVLLVKFLAHLDWTLLRETYTSSPIGSDLVILAKFIAHLDWRLLIETYTSSPIGSGLVDFTSEDDKLKAGQTREGIHKSELSNDQKLVLL